MPTAVRCRCSACACTANCDSAAGRARFGATFRRLDHAKRPLAATAAIALLSAAAQAMPHGKPGLWNITTTMQMANMPQMPPEAMAMMKQRGMKIPGMAGSPWSTRSA